MTTPDLFDLPSNQGSGYQAWQEEQRETLAAIAATWHLPIGKRVRVSLSNLDGELSGVLRIRTLPTRLNARQPLELSVDGMPILSTEIESCAVIRSGHGGAA